ncbi:MAG: single-stranded-DNA-specific exonuclease RecJ [Bacteroidales bacterium]|nr:single-stranded-DNA-specific exonuclease RecJ [Bacteroidales bacterium]
MEKRWVSKPRGDQKEVDHLAEVLNINDLLATLLVQRGIKTFDQAKSFFRPRLESLYDPFRMEDMNLAIERIEKAIQSNQRILIYGDYDVDGTTSVAMVYSFLSKFYSNLDYYIPDRYAEGYGVSYKGINYAAHDNVSLIIALDCGIKAVEKIDYANSLNIDFIICDHHTPEKNLPNAVAVLDPKRKDCAYPFKELSGCGVGFKMLQAFSRTNHIDAEYLYTFLDLVAVSIASDIVPIIDENRIMTFFGLKQLNNNPRTGLKAIIDVSGLGDKHHQIVVEDIVFRIGPRINATGRLESGKNAVDLLITSNKKKADNMAKKVNSCNDERKNIDRNITQHAIKMISSEPGFQEKKSTVLYNSSWHKGVVGIVASRMIEIYYRPTIILTASNGLATGSARSVPGFDIYEALNECSDLIENFGGHTYAAGLTIEIENINKFKQRFERIVEQNLTEEQLIPQLNIDSEIEFSNITERFYKILKQFQPFGPQNLAPLFVARDVKDTGEARLVGPNKEHMKLSLVQKNNPGKLFPGIAFQQADHYSDIHKGKPFDICFSVEENNFRGNRTLQLNIKDIKIKK